ncbi:MAG: amidohydrolase family protein, partial [Bryobacterales bacterium]|nr:amidohydrolase family protein [Bryobacterales bacterium]
MKLSAAARRSGAAYVNIGNTISFLQTQDGFLKVTAKILDRMSELATLYKDPTKSPTDKSNYGSEFTALMAEQHAIFRRHPKTTFISAHLGWYGHDLAFLGKLLDEIPNMMTELGAVIYEPGRQPRFAREFFTKYQDRILIGKDSWVPSEYKTYFRVLESNDEYFPYHKKYHAFWAM